MWQCKWRHLVANIETNASGQTCNLFKKRQLLVKSITNKNSAIWWPKLELMQVKIVEEKMLQKC